MFEGEKATTITSIVPTDRMGERNNGRGGSQIDKYL